jgi:hypothetical protein
MVFQKSVLRLLYGPQVGGSGERLEEMHNEELHQILLG